MNWKKIRSEFPILGRKINGHPLAYLDSAATSQKPRSVIDAEADFYENRNANVHRSRHTLSEEASDLFDQSHELAAKLVSAKSMREIVLTQNATMAINTVAFSLKKMNWFSKGDEIVVTEMEHHANLVPWIVLASELKLKLRVIPLDPSFELDYVAAEKIVSNRTKLVAVSHASNILGTINNVKFLSKLGHDHGALVLSDSCQAVPHFPVSVRKLGVDFLAWSSHKMCGPTGIGALYGREDLLAKMPPFLTGGEMIESVTYDQATWNSLPWKFEAGTQNIAGAIGFGAAIRFLAKIGLDNIRSHDESLEKKCRQKLSKLEDVRLIGPDSSKKVSLQSFLVEGVHSHDVSTVLDSLGIAIRSGNHCAQPLLRSMGLDSVCRASFYLYNTAEEIDRLETGLIETKRIFNS